MITVETGLVRGGMNFRKLKFWCSEEHGRSMN